MMTVLMVCVQVVLATAGGKQDSGWWTHQDIGKVTAPGSATYDEEKMIWTVRGDGSDIFGVADSFQYVCRRLQGDGWIVARVESIGKTDPWAKGGVMIRESLDPGSPFAAVYATPGSGACFQARIGTAGSAAADTAAATPEQKALPMPVWIKLERKGDLFRGYYAVDGAGTAWTPMAWKPKAIAMSKTVYVGLAVTSHASGVLCEARFGSVVVFNPEGGAIDIEVAASPQQALGRAYHNLEQLGNWRDDAEAIKKHGNLIASSLLAIARVKQRSGESVSVVLPDYYRIAKLLPDSPFAVDALIQIALLDGEEGLNYAVTRMEARSPEEKDRFHVALMKERNDAPETPAREAVVKVFVEYVGKTSDFALFEQVLASLRNKAQVSPLCKSLIRHSMAPPSNERMAVVALRYMALKLDKGPEDAGILEVVRWAATEFKGTQLAACALAILADTQYDQGREAEAVEAFQPGLFSGNQAETRIVENIETAVTSYRTSSLLPRAVDLERIYNALSQKAGGLGLNVVALHCQRKIAETKGLSLEDFARSAPKGVKYCDSNPENEIWFWKGLIAADAADLGTATAAYERFLQQDGQSVLAARAYYDIARTKMALGEEAREWIAKAKALSPCEAVTQLERRLTTKVAPQS